MQYVIYIAAGILLLGLCVFVHELGHLLGGKMVGIKAKTFSIGMGKGIIKKKVGDKVAVGDVLFSYETDKASFDEDAKVEGTVLACFFNDNDEIPCLTNVMVIGEPGESFSEYAPSGAGVSAASGAEPTSPATEPANAVAEPVARQGSPAIEVTAAATPGASASSATGTVGGIGG